jgi:hypothetical protein
MAKNCDFYVVRVYEDMDELLVVIIEIEKLWEKSMKFPFND